MNPTPFKSLEHSNELNTVAFKSPTSRSGPEETPMYRDIEHTARFLQAHRIAVANPLPRRRARRPRLVVGAFLVRVGERLATPVETPVGA